MSNTEEEWKTIKDFSNYHISNLGNIKNLKGQYISFTERTGYLRASITNDSNKRQTISVHVLVAKNFLGDPHTEKQQVNHKNGMKSDNRVCNLEWISPSDNILHAQESGLMEKFKKSVKQYDLNDNFIKEWPSATDAERSLGLSKIISNVCLGNHKTGGGFIWKFSENIDEKQQDNEVWRPFRDTKYQISDRGRVKDTRGEIKRERIRDNRSEHNLHINNKDYTFQTGRLVAEVFIDNPNNLKQVDHIDKNSLNNNVDNLRWISASDNIKHSFARKVVQYSLTGDFIKLWNCMSDVTKEYNINISCIADACKGKQKTSCGYIWKYEDELKEH
jgi:hypothetical protein